MTDIEEVKVKVVGNVCQMVSLFPEEPQQMLLHTLLKECLETDDPKS